MSKFLSRVDRHLLSCAATGVAAATGAGILSTAQTAEAAVVYSGLQNLSITPNLNGIYVNMVSGLTGTPSSAVPGWDMNPWVTGSTGSTPAWRLFANGNSTNPDGGTLITGGTDALELNMGDIVGPAGTYSTSSGVVPANGTNFFGVRLLDEATNQIHYGWVRLTLPALSGPPAGPAGTLVDWAYEDTPGAEIAAGAGIPEPASLGLLALGAVGLLRRRSVA